MFSSTPCNKKRVDSTIGKRVRKQMCLRTNKPQTYMCNCVPPHILTNKCCKHTKIQMPMANSILRARMHIRKHSITHTPEHHKQINTHNHAHARTCTFGRAHKIILFHVVACIVPPVVRLCVSCYVPGVAHLY